MKIVVEFDIPELQQRFGSDGDVISYINSTLRKKGIPAVGIIMFRGVSYGDLDIDFIESTGQTRYTWTHEEG